MSQSLKRFTALALTMGLVLHFILVIVSGGAENSKLTRFAGKYTEPLFHQTWKLFVPPPEYNYHVYVRSLHDKTWSAWQDELTHLLEKHQCNRFAGHELSLLALSNSLFYLNGELPDTNTVYNNPPDSPAFRIFQKAIFHFTTNVETADGVEMMIVRENQTIRNIYYFRNLH
ncbi:MAG: hypothetical protein JST26_06950 [Bacteroidetes bacterium]|nr:hypothetical protein [Bacteroidota bacterium]